MPEYKDITLIVKEIEEGKKNLHFKNAENAEICAGVLAFVQGVIDRVPEADVVDVVRCKDCVYAKQVKPFDDIFKCTYLKPNTRMFDIDYCRYGKRKEV